MCEARGTECLNTTTDVCRSQPCASCARALYDRTAICATFCHATEVSVSRRLHRVMDHKQAMPLAPAFRKWERCIPAVGHDICLSSREGAHLFMGPSQKALGADGAQTPDSAAISVKNTCPCPPQIAVDRSAVGAADAQRARLTPTPNNYPPPCPTRQPLRVAKR